MAIQDLYIKNMVCERCLHVVRQELEKRGYQVLHLEMGKARVERSAIELPAIQTALGLHNFELLIDRNTQLVNQIKTLIIDLIHTGQVTNMKLTLSGYLAEQTGHDYTYLSHLFSATENLTIEKYWILQRVEKAKELLSYKELTISEVAWKLGYSSVAYLSNQFKQITGMTPVAFRNLSIAERNPLDWI